MSLFSMLGNAAAAAAINSADLASSGKIMLMGMCGIFLVIIVIFLIVLALTAIFPEKKKKD